MGSFILALDQGTTSSRAILFDRSGRVAAMAQQTFPQHYPQPGWVEHDPLELWESQRSVAAQALRKLGPDARIAGIGITNQRETTILWDKATGEPVYNAIVWQCRRTAGICDKLKETPGMAASRSSSMSRLRSSSFTISAMCPCGPRKAATAPHCA